MQREALLLKKKGQKIVLVPTMGALHEGHLSLVKRARKRGDVVIMSIYVNPTQFGPSEDYTKYPRPRKKDQDLARNAGVDVLFAPKALYAKDESTRVVEGEKSKGRCGRYRSGHFDGVCTVVAKLFMIVQPDYAVFGQKDAQQCDVIERMARDLCFPVKVIRAPLIRDKNGLALSSRNRYLSDEEYQMALQLPQILARAASCGDSKRAVAQARTELIDAPGLRLQYVEAAGKYLCAAVYVGQTRLIDNMPILAGATGSVVPAGF